MADEWRAAGRNVAGVLSPAVFEGGIKVGIDALNLRGGECRRLAVLRNPEQAAGDMPATRQWLFSPTALAWGDDVLACATPCGLLVVDELGPLEFERGEGWLSGLVALDGRAYDLALAVIRPELLETALQRWPWGIVKKI
jgi:nucleoside-triphosphatase THEP1